MAQDVTQENAEVCLGAKAHHGLVPPGAAKPKLNPNTMVQAARMAQDVTQENAEVCLGAKAHQGLVPPGAVPPAAAAHAPLLRASSRYYEEATGVGAGGKGSDARHAPQDEQTVC